MAPALPGSLPRWITPGRLVMSAQLVGLSFVVSMLGAWLSLSLGVGLCVWGGATLLFFLLAWITGGQSSWIAVAASYGEIGAWLGSASSAAFFIFFFVSEARPHETATFCFAMICTALLGWLPGLLAGLLGSFVFWGLGGWLLAAKHQHEIFPAHDDVHQSLLRVAGWLGALGALGLWVALSPLLYALALGLLLCGVGLGAAALVGLKRRARWLREVRAGRVLRWRVLPLVGAAAPLLPLSNRHSQEQLLVYRAEPGAPYRSYESEELPVALC